MKAAMSIICSMVFAICGISLAMRERDPSFELNSMQMMASTAPNVYAFPRNNISPVDLSEDLVRDLAKKYGVQDTVYVTKTDTIIERVQTVKRRKVAVPTPVVMRDTIREAHYYLIKQVGTKENPTGDCIPIYEVHKVNEVCPETNESSVIHTPQYDIEVGE